MEFYFKDPTPFLYRMFVWEGDLLNPYQWGYMHVLSLEAKRIRNLLGKGFIFYFMRVDLCLFLYINGTLTTVSGQIYPSLMTFQI